MTPNPPIFAYPRWPHARRHGPRGYRDYQNFKPWLRDEFTFRCVYCLFRERWYPAGHAAFGIDHVLPRSVRPDLACDFDNLVYACSRCNSLKQEAALTDPCAAGLAGHVHVTDDGSAEALTREGRRMIRLLRLDQLNEWRSRLLRVLARIARLGEAATAELHAWLGYPDDLPDLEALRPPGGNARPEGVMTCYVARLRGGEPLSNY